MYKVTIRKTEEIVLHEDFEPTDYPLVNLVFTMESLLITYIYHPAQVDDDDTIDHKNLLIALTLSEDAYMKLTGEFPIKDGIDASGLKSLKRASLVVRNIISDILNCSCHPKFKKVYLKAKVSELLVTMLSTDFIEKPSNRWTEREILVLTEIKELISLNLEKNHSIEQLAEISGMNRTKLQEGFKDLFSKTIYAYTTDLKMLQAKLLLEAERGSSLKEIAGMLGYKHTNHFSAAFKKRYNFSPSFLKRKSS